MAGFKAETFQENLEALFMMMCVRVYQRFRNSLIVRFLSVNSLLKTIRLHFQPI